MPETRRSARPTHTKEPMRFKNESSTADNTPLRVEKKKSASPRYAPPAPRTTPKRWRMVQSVLASNASIAPIVLSQPAARTRNCSSLRCSPFPRQDRRVPAPVRREKMSIAATKSYMLPLLLPEDSHLVHQDRS